MLVYCERLVGGGDFGEYGAKCQSKRVTSERSSICERRSRQSSRLPARCIYVGSTDLDQVDSANPPRAGRPMHAYLMTGRRSRVRTGSGVNRWGSPGREPVARSFHT